MRVSKPQNTTPKATASMAAVIRSIPRQPIRGRVARMVARALGDGSTTGLERWVLRGSVMVLGPYPVESAWLDASGRQALVIPAGARAQTGISNANLRSQLPSPVLAGAGSRVCGEPHSQRYGALPCCYPDDDTPVFRKPGARSPAPHLKQGAFPSAASEPRDRGGGVRPDRTSSRS